MSSVNSYTAVASEAPNEVALLRRQLEIKHNDLLDALDLKKGKGPTALSMLKSDRDAYIEAIRDLLDAWDKDGDIDLQITILRQMLPAK
jgi:hypothetical protein